MAAGGAPGNGRAGACRARLSCSLAVLTTLAALVGGAAVKPACAHHSFAVFDDDAQLKLRGTVTSFMWSNPHVYIGLAVMEDRGTLNTYILECASPGILERLGWRSNILRPGDAVTVIVAPLKTGDPVALVKQLIMPDGRRLSDGTLAGDPDPNIP